VDSVDEMGNTPLHIAAECTTCPELVQTLMKCGAHPDQCNSKKETFDDLNTEARLSSLVNYMPYVTLKCLAAREVSKQKIPYKNIVPVSLESFIELH